jgi:hypothetical protein
MTATATKPKVGRPKTPLDIAEQQALARVAALSANILVALRRPGRGAWDGERQIRAWLQEDGTPFTTSDFEPAMTLLESVRKIGRELEKRTPRDVADSRVLSSSPRGAPVPLPLSPLLRLS